MTPPASKNQFIQFLRGISITAVVFLHCLGKDNTAALIMKPWLYFGVLLFVFLSGYLTPASKVTNVFSFYKKRLLKVLIPLIIWTAIYLLIDGVFTPYMWIRGIIRGNASGQLYYLVDYAELVVLTPLIFRLKNKKLFRIILYAITPCHILLNYYMKWHNQSSLIPICGWLLTMYMLGLEHEKFAEKVSKVKPSFSIILVLITGVLQTFESFMWRFLGVEGLTNTQNKFTTLFFVLAVLVLLSNLTEAQKEKAANIKVFTKLGDYSFGIFCCHKVFLEFFALYIPKAMPFSLILFPLSLFCSVATVWIFQKILPKKVCGWFGFV